VIFQVGDFIKQLACIPAQKLVQSVKWDQKGWSSSNVQDLIVELQSNSPKRVAGRLAEIARNDETVLKNVPHYIWCNFASY